ncbi:MAG: RHS repeat domain-containing protein [Alistipes indistinctus]
MKRRTWTKVDAVRKPWSWVTIGEENAYVDEVRVYPQDARMTTYTYLPGIGMTSQTDPNGHTVYYRYDALGRLSAIRDNERRLLKSYQYE